MYLFYYTTNPERYSYYRIDDDDHLAQMCAISLSRKYSTFTIDNVHLAMRMTEEVEEIDNLADLLSKVQDEKERENGYDINLCDNCQRNPDLNLICVDHNQGEILCEHKAVLENYLDTTLGSAIIRNGKLHLITENFDITEFDENDNTETEFEQIPLSDFADFTFDVVKDLSNYNVPLREEILRVWSNEETVHSIAIKLRKPENTIRVVMNRMLKIGQIRQTKSVHVIYQKVFQ